VADYVYVMRSGEIVEEGAKETIFAEPSHPYTQTLLAAAPVLRQARSERPLDSTAREV
jgi:peptide/nickel transport system ATP-binding protein